MIADVLSRFPVKSPLRFRSASKRFCSMIDGPDITKLHLNRSKQSLLVLTSLQLYTVDLPSLERAFKINQTVLDGTEVIGSCNGLLCLYNSDAGIVVLWNISTRKHHRLPYIPVISFNLLYVAHGFGYDPVHNNYNVIRVVQFCDLDTQVMIYSLKSNSWKRVGAFPYILAPFRSVGVSVDGAIHWLIYHPQGDISTSAFDLATEEYRVVPRPPVAPDGSFLGQMMAWESRLCAIYNYVGKPTEIWVLEHNGVEESWEKLLSISDPQFTASPHNIVPMAYVSSGNELVLLQDNDKFLSYDLRTNKAKDVVIQGVPPYSFDAVRYVESLVNPSPVANGDDAAMEKHKGPRSKKNVAKRGDFLSKRFKLVLRAMLKKKTRARALGNIGKLCSKLYDLVLGLMLYQYLV